MNFSLNNYLVANCVTIVNVSRMSDIDNNNNNNIIMDNDNTINYSIDATKTNSNKLTTMQNNSNSNTTTPAAVAIKTTFLLQVVIMWIWEALLPLTPLTSRHTFGYFNLLGSQVDTSLV